MAASGKITHYRVGWEPTADAAEVTASSIGGYPILPPGEAWPVCSEGACGKRLSLFLQVAVEDRFGLPFAPGSTLGVFQCVEHDDPFEELDTKAPRKRGAPLPDAYWQHANYALYFTGPGEQQQRGEREPFVSYSRLDFTAEREPKRGSVDALNYKSIKIGGSPFWVQKPKLWGCSCGAEMAFLCSIPGNLRFPRAEGSPRQPNVYSDGHHFLFLGLSTYIFACKAHCHPRAVVAVRQN
jgi:hypothetical protein